jgi:2-polyprenyl-6-methoxyphenol hydroxylase-like FAD-dependent oxidoreductase
VNGTGHIAIVGLGVCGAAAAALLARRGHRVVVYEQSPVLGAVGAGVLLQPSGQIVLRRMGLLDEVAAAAERVDRLTAVTYAGRTLIDLPYREIDPSWHALGVRRGALFDVLHRAAVAAGVKIAPGVRIVRCIRADRALTPALSRSTRRGSDARTRLLDDAGRVVADADFVIAADGSRSTLRSTSRQPKFVYRYPHGAIWLTGRCPDSVRNRLYQVTRGTQQLCGLLPTGGGEASLFWSARQDEWPAIRARGFTAFRDDCVRLCPPAEQTLAGVDSFDDVRFTTYRHVHMPRWHNAGMIFLGDAAHAMSPHLGQGINLALLDAAEFAAAVEESETFSEAAELAHRRRRRQTSFYAAVTAALSPFFQSRGMIKGWGRDVVLPLMPKVRPLRRLMIQTMAGMRGLG